MVSIPTLRGLAARASSQTSSTLLQTLLRPFACPATAGTATTTTSRQPTTPASSRTIHTTPSLSAPPRGGGGKGRGGGGGPQGDPKIAILTKGLRVTNYVPPPLRMARNRHLRHWTIHRAWLLFRRRQRDARERELMRQYQSLHNACEELRGTAGPGSRETGYLYRVAMEKKGIYGHHGVPIEYARPQTETPAREAWNHGWKR